MKDKISKRSVDALKAGERDALLWDSEVRGFGVRCRQSGIKYYVLKYRSHGGRQRWCNIGRHGSSWTPDSARREALRLLGEVAAGHDPAEKRAETRREMSVEELCDFYLSEGCSTKKESSRATDKSNIERHIKPLLGKLRVRTVTRAEIERFQRDVAAGKTAVDIKTKMRGRAIVSGGKGTAARSVAVLGAIFSFAVLRELRPDNPTRGVKLYKGERKERFLNASELSRLGHTLKEAERNGENPVAIAAIRLLLMTGARKSEILTARWNYVDTERSLLRLPDSKTGAKTIPLGAPALEVLANLLRFEGNSFILPGANGGHLVGLQKLWERLRNRAGLQDVRLHDLRHSFASVAVAGGDSLYLIGKVLGHRQSRTTEVYAHLADDPLQAVANRASGQIAAALNGTKGEGAEVVPLPVGKA